MPRLLSLTTVLSPLLLAGCADALHDATFPTGSQTIIGAGDGETVYVVDSDAKAVVRHDVDGGDVSSVEVGGEPARLARVGTRVLATLRDARSIAVVEDRGGTLELVETVEVGPEPVGLVAREDGTRVYVALAAQDEVLELDGDSLAVLRRFEVEGQPTWLALHPSGGALYVGSAMGGGVSWVDLDDGAVAALQFPRALGAGEDGQSDLTRRVTGDLSVSSDGARLAVPALYVDNTTDVSAPDDGTVSQSSGYASSSDTTLSRLNPAVVFVPLQSDGEPDGSNIAPVFVAGFDDGFDVVRSYPSSVTFSPDGLYAYATMEGSETVVAIGSTPVWSDDDAEFVCEECNDTGSVTVMPSQGGFATAPRVYVHTMAGPRGVAFVNDEDAVVDCWLDREIAPAHAKWAASLVGDQTASGFVGDAAITGDEGVSIGDSPIDFGVQAGRRRFYSAVDPEMSSSGSGVSCATCHYRGRNDGLTWPLENGPRQTPSLAGGISLTGPFTWADAVPAIEDEAMITSQGRMGGDGLSESEATAVAHFVDTVARPVAPDLDGDAVARGAEIFARAEVGCAECHSGSLFTDNTSWPLFGLDAVNTPSLRGLAATAPYLHDGSADTLRKVLELSRYGVMGDTSSLSDAELDDLETYLLSL